MFLIKYYWLMKRNQSSLETSISGYYFAVCSVDLTFQKDYQCRFTLYYEKSLQIITKFQTPSASATKGQPISFDAYHNLQHFRIQSEKNLDYQWSLYMHQENQSEENEEFVEGQKISLKNAWTSYQEKREGVIENLQEFNTVKCKLNFIVVIGKSSAELPVLAQQYFQKKNGKYVAPKQAEKPMKKMIDEPQEKIEKQQGQQASLPPVQSRERASRSLEEQSNIKLDAAQKVETDVEPSKILASDLKESKIIYESPFKAPIDGESPQKQTPTAQNVNKLTLSEIQIGKHIEKEVSTYQATKKLQLPEEQVIVEAEPLHQTSNSLAVEKENKDNEIRVTQSQLLNDKKEIIIPVYKRKNVIVLFVILVFLIAGGFFLSQHFSKQQPQKSESSRKGKKQAKTKEPAPKQPKKAKQPKKPKQQIKLQKPKPSAKPKK